MMPTRVATLLLAALLWGCGGGGNGGSGSGGVPGSTPAGSAPPVSSGPPPPPNSAPFAVVPNEPMLVAAPAAINYDATQGGTAFKDADGDALTYDLQFLSPSMGLVIQGTDVIGTLATPGVVQLQIVARDGHGGAADRKFAFAVAAAEPGRPILPAVPFVYEDALLSLPYYIPKLPPVDEYRPYWFRLTNAGATLGRVLFYDKRLSITNTHSCASCHQQAYGFASPNRFPTGVTNVPLRRNALALTNVRWNKTDYYFMDQRAWLLEDAVKLPIVGTHELGNTMKMLVAKLTATDFYPALFNAEFGSPEVTEDRIAIALAEFLRSIYSYQSTYDTAQGPIGLNAYTDQEWRGAQLFKQKSCFGCHGILEGTAPRNIGLDAVVTDPGAGGGRFRAASLKNISATAPYMHDGRYGTLREVLDHYSDGIVDSPNLGLPFREIYRGETKLYRIEMTAQEKADILAFMATLTDNALLTDQRWSDPFPY